MSPMELLPWLVIEEHLLSASDGLGEFGSILILSSCSPKSFGVGACDLAKTGVSGGESQDRSGVSG